jgi:phosphoheptose isomerase
MIQKFGDEMIDFENIDEKLKQTCETEEWKSLVQKFKKSKKIYIIGNGGLHFTAAHAATDCTRLIPNKACFSFDTTGFITSLANDYEYENLYIKWLDSIVIEGEIGDSLVIGMSCSGNSKNITRCLSWANSKGFETFMISGRKSKRLESGLGEVILDCKYFHTVEVLCLVLFYQMIHEMGSECPSILKEVERKDPWAV